MRKRRHGRPLECARAAKLNDGWKAEGRTELGFGIGINHGEAVIGNIEFVEPHERLDPTFIGDSLILPRAWNLLTRTYRWNSDRPTAAELVRDDFIFARSRASR